MRPYLQSYIPVTLAGAFSLAIALFAGCSESGSSSPSPAIQATAAVTMRLDYIKAPLADSLVLDCYGADTLHYSLDPESPYIDLDLFPSDSWKFEARLYANGALMQQGEATARLEAGTAIDIAIQMHAIVGFVYVEIPLGLKNPAGIASGSMTLEGGGASYTYPMQVAGSTAVFKSEMLPLGYDYDLTITMRDSAGTDIYRVSETFRLDESSPVPELQIKSLRTDVHFDIDFAGDVNVSISTALPAKRTVPRPGDLLITEFMTSPLRSDSTQYEFIELYNGTLDTLLLAGCTLGATSQESKSWPITLEYIAPGKAAVFGDTSASTPPKYRNTATWGDLTNTKGSIVVACGGEPVDSLFYSATQDTVLNNLVPNSSTTTKNPLSTHLDIGMWDSRENPASWCIGSPTPGAVEFCE